MSIFTHIKERPLLSIFILAISVRLLLLLLFPLPDYSGGDFPLYQRIADAIVTEGNLGGEPQKTYGSPSINPGWAFVLAGLTFLFGASQNVLLIFSVLLGGVLAVGVYLLSMFFFNRKISFLAGLTTALWPAFLIQTFIYTDSLLFYTVLLVWSTFFFVKAVLEGSSWGVAVSGFLLGFAILVDSIAFFIPLVFLVWLFLERPSFRSLGLSALFLGVCFLVIVPWMYRNISIAEELGLGSAPAISKDELRLISPSKLLTISRLVAKEGVLISGLSQTFLFPFNISILDQGTNVYYKDTLVHLLRGDQQELSRREAIIMGLKIAITALHWAVLILSIVSLFLIHEKQTRRFLLFALLLLLYVVAGSIGFGSLWGNDFKGISALSSFLFPLIPLFIVAASFSLFSLIVQWEKKNGKNIEKITV